MFNKEKTERRHLEMKEIQIRLERLEAGYQDLLNDLGLTQDDLNQHQESPDAFPQEIWDGLQNVKQQIDTKISLALTNIENPAKVERRRKSQARIKNNWIFCR